MKWTIQSLREVGAFQWSAIFMYAVTIVPLVWGDIGILVIVPKIPHWCHDSSSSFQSLTTEQQRHIMTSSEVCQRPDVNFVNMNSEELLTSNFSAVRWIDCDQGVSYDHSEFDFTATEQYNLGCGNEWIISVVKSFYMCGFLLGAAASGAIADRVGRKPVVVASCILGAGAHLLTSLAPNLTLFLAGRLIAATSEIAAQTGSAILCVEYLRKDQRVLPLTTMVLVSSVIGNACFGALAMAVRSHQQILMIISALHLLGAFANLCYLPESPRWLTSQNRLDEARAVAQRIATFNKQSLDHLQHLLSKDDLLLPNTDLGRKANFFDLVRTPTLRKRTFILCTMWCNLVLVAYALLYNLDDFGPDVRTSIILSAALELPALALLMFFVDRFGRQVSSFCYMFLAGVCCFAMAPLVGATNSPMLLALALLGRLFSSNQFVLFYIYTPELYPTVIRSMGLGSSSTVSRVAGILAPQVALLNRYWAPSMVVILGVAGFISVQLTPFLPDTTGYELPQSLEDGERFQSGHRYRLVLPLDFRTRKCSNDLWQDRQLQKIKATMDDPKFLPESTYDEAHILLHYS